MFVIIDKKKFKTAVICIIVLLFAIISAALCSGPIARIVYPQKYSEFVETASKKYNIDKLLIYSVIKAESGFNKNAVSKSGAKGLMQIMDETADWAAVKSGVAFSDIYDPETNIMLGTWYLNYLYSQNSDLITVLASYNAGGTNVEKWRKRAGVEIISTEHIEFDETKEYVTRILKYYKNYKKIYGG